MKAILIVLKLRWVTKTDFLLLKNSKSECSFSFYSHHYDVKMITSLVSQTELSLLKNHCVFAMSVRQ